MGKILAAFATILLTACFAGAADTKIPIILDTDIGTDIDDAFALALIINSPELQLLGVTTVSGDTAARACLAAKFLWGSGGEMAAGAGGGRRAGASTAYRADPLGG